MKVLADEEWRGRRAAHAARVRPWIAPRLERMSAGERHPVDDFLFEYYSFRPGQLERWHPGFGHGLAGAGEEYRGQKYYAEADGVVFAEVGKLLPERAAFVEWLRSLLRATAERAGVFGCFGLHEWAMVYRAEEVRHERWPLRLAPERIAEVVEGAALRCTHYDAFRFFTPEARPLNRVQLSREAAAEHEQGGCLHANMDLYKWAYKLSPFTPSELVADAFELAREIRTLDMRASPYDLAALGYVPVRLETAEGRAEYEARQRAFAERARPIRARLLAVCEELLAAELV